jgi:hypothetical protein
MKLCEQHTVCFLYNRYDELLIYSNIPSVISTVVCESSVYMDIFVLRFEFVVVGMGYTIQQCVFLT